MLSDNEIKFNVVYKTYKTYIKNICRKYTDDKDLLEDYVNETFIRIYKNIENVNLDCCKTYLSLITKSSCIDCIRKNKKHKMNVSIEDNQYDEPSYDSACEENGVEYIKSLILELKNPYRDIFTMFAIEGLRHKEIAEKLNMNINTVRCDYMKARTMLAERISAEKKFTGIDIF